MEKFIKYIFIGIIISFGIIFPLYSDFSYAQTTCPNDDLGQPIQDGTCIPGGANTTIGGVGGDVVGPSTPCSATVTTNCYENGGGGEAVAAAQQAAQETKLAGTKGACDGLMKIWDDPWGCLVGGVVSIVLTIVSKALWLTGIFFNYAMDFTLNISSQATNIASVWVVVRDLINIAFIFALLFVAISTILDMGDYKKYLVAIIISAIFINFSLFFTKVIIDISNTFAYQFYYSISGGNPGGNLDGGITAQFMDRLGLASIFGAGSGGQAITASGGLSIVNLALVGLFGSIFILIAAAVFLIAALMMVTRTAVLMFLMIVSPVGFIGGWIPKLGDWSEKWRKTLFDQCLVAPIFLMFIYIILKITSIAPSSSIGTVTGGNLSFGSGSGNFAGALAGAGASSMSVVLWYCLIIAFLITAMTVTKSLSGHLGAQGSKLIGGAVGGVGGWVGRQTVGRVAARVAESESLKNLASKSRVGMLALKGTEKVARSSFDVRNARVPGALGNVTGGILKEAGVDIGLGRGTGTGGFRKSDEEAVKAKSKSQQDAAKLLDVSKIEEERIKRRKEEENRNKLEHDKGEEEREALHNEAQAPLKEEHDKKQLEEKEKYEDEKDKRIVIKASLDKQYGKDTQKAIDEYDRRFGLGSYRDKNLGVQEFVAKEFKPQEFKKVEYRSQERVEYDKIGEKLKEEFNKKSQEEREEITETKKKVDDKYSSGEEQKKAREKYDRENGFGEYDKNFKTKEAKARYGYDQEHGEGKYNEEFFTQDEFKEEEIESAKEINEARRAGLVQQLKTPVKVADIPIVGAIPVVKEITIDRPFESFIPKSMEGALRPVGVRGNLDAAGALEKTQKDLGKIETEIDDLKSELKKTLGKALEKTVDDTGINIKNIEEAIKKLDELAAKEEINSNDITKPITERAKSMALKKSYERDVKKLETMPGQLEKNQDKLGEAKKPKQDSGKKGVGDEEKDKKDK